MGLLDQETRKCEKYITRLMKDAQKDNGRLLRPVRSYYHRKDLFMKHMNVKDAVVSEFQFEQNVFEDWKIVISHSVR